MIRRDCGSDWLLFSQIDHARIAGELALLWENEAIQPLPISDQFLSAVIHHDAGWQEWEQAPTIDPETGFPRDFTEMPMPVATDIWTKSIEHCRQFGMFPAIWVSKHFTYLAECALESRQEDAVDVAALETFLQQQRKNQPLWQEDVLDERVEELVESGYRMLQLFDRLSLWMTICEQTEISAIDVYGGGTLQRIPVSPFEITFEPWPFRKQEIRLGVPAKRIPQKRFQSDDEFQEELAHANVETLEWVIANK